MSPDTPAVRPPASPPVTAPTQPPKRHRRADIVQHMTGASVLGAGFSGFVTLSYAALNVLGLTSFLPSCPAALGSVMTGGLAGLLVGRFEAAQNVNPYTGLTHHYNPLTQSVSFSPWRTMGAALLLSALTHGADITLSRKLQQKEADAEKAASQSRPVQPDRLTATYRPS